MNLSPLIKTDSQLEEAKELILDGKLSYQPFIFADDLEVGIGYEALCGEFSGSVYWPTIDPKVREEVGKIFVSNKNKDQFTKANQRLRIMYDTFIDEICTHIGDVSQTTFADIGCQSGYFPISFSLRGAKRAVGYDRVDFSKNFNLLNSIMGTNAEFVHESYNGRTQTICGCESYDVVISIAVLSHLSDPLQHLAFLGSIARRALFIETDVTQAAQVEDMVQAVIAAYGRLDYAFNNAGSGGAGGWAAEIAEADWDETIDIYLKSVWLCMKYEIIRTRDTSPRRYP